MFVPSRNLLSLESRLLLEEGDDAHDGATASPAKKIAALASRSRRPRRRLAGVFDVLCRSLGMQ